MAVSNQPWPVGQTYQYWAFPVYVESAADDLTGVDITKFTMNFRTLNGVNTAGTGTFSIWQVYPAIILYKPSVADVANAFNGYIDVNAFYPPSNTNADEVGFDPIPWQVTAR
jgi:hypothetical protein